MLLTKLTQLPLFGVREINYLTVSSDNGCQQRLDYECESIKHLSVSIFSLFGRTSRFSRLHYLSLYLLFYIIIHMCIQGLGHFSPLPPPPPFLIKKPNNVDYISIK
jgi:hypothetical protein